MVSRHGTISMFIIFKSLGWESEVNKKQRETLLLIFKEPPLSNIKWIAVESLFTALGAEISQGSGSRIRIAFNGVKAVFHRPHPRKETDKGALVSVRRFLENAGIKNDEI